MRRVRRLARTSQRNRTIHYGMGDTAEGPSSFARSCPHAASMSNPREYRTDVGIPAVAQDACKVLDARRVWTLVGEDSTGLSGMILT